MSAVDFQAELQRIRASAKKKRAGKDGIHGAKETECCVDQCAMHMETMVMRSDDESDMSGDDDSGTSGDDDSEEESFEGELVPISARPPPARSLLSAPKPSTRSSLDAVAPTKAQRLAPVTVKASSGSAMMRARPITRAEMHLLRWFRESHSGAAYRSNVQDHASSDSPVDTVVVQCATTGPKAHVTMITETRMREIGMVLSDGRVPAGAPSRPLYWIQAKPDELKTFFGRWDPLAASWTFHKKRVVVPIEARYAPVGVGYGTNPHPEGDETSLVNTPSYFADCGPATLYHGTGLEPGVDFIQSQASQLVDGCFLGSQQGWGSASAGDALYYTPHLRHVEIDRQMADDGIADKQFVHGWFNSDPVLPEISALFRTKSDEIPQPHGIWNSTNSCWIFPLKNGEFTAHRYGSAVQTERECDTRLKKRARKRDTGDESNDESGSDMEE